MFAIITPTYIEHFKYINKYLESFVKYVEDKQNIQLYFIISKSEKGPFKKTIKNYVKKCNINVLYFEELLNKYRVNITTEKLLKDYGRFTFQTLKKMYAICSIEEEKSLVLDSESMWIRKTNMKKLFDDFFNNPFITCSDLNKRYVKQSGLVAISNKNINSLLNKECDKWFLENFVWFYDKKILLDLFKEHGALKDMADRIRNLKDPLRIRGGIFEITLYQNFIYHNAGKYGYKIIDADELLETALGRKRKIEFIESFRNAYKGNCGVLEQSMACITEDNYVDIAYLFRQNNFNIIRCEKTNIDNYQLQRKFLNIVKPNILAASQEHGFGVANAFQHELMKNDKIRLKYKKHKTSLKEHFSSAFKIPRELISYIFYLIRWQFQKTKIKWKIKKI